MIICLQENKTHSKNIEDQINQKSERLHAFITGRVQGVGFRFFVLRQAENLSMTGWVRNLSEGRVEVLAEGSPQKIDRLISMISLGPPGSIVLELSINRDKASGEFNDFRVISSA